MPEKVSEERILWSLRSLTASLKSGISESERKNKRPFI
jgi:hypothetical protein